MKALALIMAACAVGLWLVRLVPKRPAVRDEDDEMHLRYIREEQKRKDREP